MNAPLVRYQINNRARRILVRIDPVTREAVATMPSLRALREAEAFVNARADWIAERLADLPEPRPFTKGATIPFKGRDVLLVCSGTRGRPRVRRGRPPLLDVPAPNGAFAGRVRRHLMAEARAALEPRVETYAGMLRARVTRITVKDTTSRWGSCAPGGALAFSWRLICAPTRVLDYVAAHEVAHLREPNHSDKFWRLVERLVGDHDRPREWLREHGPSLFAVGAEE